MLSGVPIGRQLTPQSYIERPEAGSIVIVLATDAPLDNRQLGRLAKRAAFGLARTGSNCHTGSGDYVIAFSTTYQVEDRPNEVLSNRPTLANEHHILSILGQAVIEGVEEAIYNSMLFSPTMVGRNGNRRYGLPADRVVEMMQAYAPKAK